MPEQPDFRLIVMPSNTRQPAAEVIGAGSAQYYTVLAWRQDGFDGPIALSVGGLPPGLTCPPQYLGANQRQAALVIAAAPDAPPWTGLIAVKGTAKIDDRVLVREARPASITWGMNAQQQPNTPALSRIDHGLALAVRDKAFFAVKPKQDAVKALPGEKVNLAFHLDKLQADFKAPVQLSLANFPGTTLVFNNNAPLTLSGDKEASGVLDVRAGLAPGNYTVVLRATSQVPFSKDAKAKTKTNVSIVSAALPITLTVLAKETAAGALTLTPGELTIQKGQSAEIKVKLKRPANATGELRVQVIIPNGVMGVTAEDTVIPAGKDSARVRIKVAMMTNSGPRNLSVRVSQPSGKTPVNAEAKLTVTVVRPPM